MKNLAVWQNTGPDYNANTLQVYPVHCPEVTTLWRDRNVCIIIIFDPR